MSCSEQVLSWGNKLAIRLFANCLHHLFAHSKRIVATENWDGIYDGDSAHYTTPYSNGATCETCIRSFRHYIVHLLCSFAGVYRTSPNEFGSIPHIFFMCGVDADAMFKQLFWLLPFMKRALIVSLKMLNELKRPPVRYNRRFLHYKMCSILAILCYLHSLRWCILARSYFTKSYYVKCVYSINLSPARASSSSIVSPPSIALIPGVKARNFWSSSTQTVWRRGPLLHKYAMRWEFGDRFCCVREAHARFAVKLAARPAKCFAELGAVRVNVP